MLVKGSFVSRWVNHFWVKSVVVPQNPLVELKLDHARPIIYVLDQNSASDLLALQKACADLALPDPYQSLSLHGTTLPAVIYLHDGYFFKKQPLKHDQAVYLQQYQTLLTLHQAHSELDVQLVPVTCFWGRDPGKQNPRKAFLGHSNPSAIAKAWMIIRSGKDHLVRFNSPLSVRALVNKNKTKSTKQQAYKLARLALYYFSSQHRSGRGPQIPDRKAMIKQVIDSSMLQTIMAEHSKQSGLPVDKINKECHAYLEEISSNFSYRFLRVFRALLSKVWNGIYQGIEVHHAQAVRDATQSGAEIIYMPCHRSHMDYLLVSYLLHAEGLVPPHIAAGVNLNFFPAGGIFRRSGAFFLRRSFKDNPLYGKVFKAYFAMLFKQGYPIEFFTEGGRSRTGRLLPAKTGLLAMSVQTFLAQPERNVMIVPIYIGYDHIMEVSTYMKELSGQKKEKESAWQVLGIIKKLRNFGRAFVNFGEPINLKQHLDQHQPQWRDQALTTQQVNDQVNHLAMNVMQGINHVTAVNALPLCGAILLANTQHQLGKQRLLDLLSLHQILLESAAQDSAITYPQQSAEQVYQQALQMDKFSETDHVVSCTPVQSAQLTYYRNTIVHVFALPALLSFGLLALSKKACVAHGGYQGSGEKVSKQQLLEVLSLLFPFVQAEYFLADCKVPLDAQIERVLLKFEQLHLIRLERDEVTLTERASLQVLSAHLEETRLRYQTVLTLLSQDMEQSDDALLAACKVHLQDVSIEPFDPKVLMVFFNKLDRKNATLEDIVELQSVLSLQ